MDATEVSMHLLSVTIPGVQMFTPDRGTAMAIATNDTLAAVVTRYPKRFADFARMAPQAPGEASLEMKRAVTKLCLNGFIINSHTHNRDLDDPFFAPVLEAAEALDQLFCLYPRAPSNGIAAPVRDYSIGGSIWGFGAEAGTHAVRLITSVTLDCFQKLRFLLGHMGEALPFWMWRLDPMAARRQRDGRMKPLQMLPSAYFLRNFAVTTSGFEDPDVLKMVISRAGIDNVLWAIDYPYEDSADAVRFIDAAPLTDKQRSAILCRNAERLFHIPAS